MPIVQNTFANTIPEGLAGGIVNGEASNRITRTIEDAAGVGFGKAVFRGSGDHGCTKTPGTPLLGITMVDHGLVLLPGGTADTYPQYANVPICSDGNINVVAGANVADGDAVYVTAAGVFTNVSTSNTALPGWVFDATRASGAIVPITTNR